MNIVLIGFTCAGKSTVGQLLAERHDYHFIDTDRLTESFFTQTHGFSKSVSSIYKEYGETTMRDFEKQAVASLQGINNAVIATGGGTLMQEKNKNVLKFLGRRIYLHIEYSKAQQRMEKKQISAYLNSENLFKDFRNRYIQRLPIYENHADFKVIVSNKTPSDIVSEITMLLKRDVQHA